MFGEGILDRLPMRSSLHDADNEFRKVFLGTVGALLDDFDITDSMEGVYLQSATGVYLDMFGRDFNVPRRLDEADDDYRKRLTFEVLGYLTSDYLLNVYELPVYTRVTGFDLDDNTLVSDNPFIKESGFMCVADAETRRLLDSKFVLDGGVEWLVL